MYIVHSTVLVRLNSLNNLQIYFIMYLVILLFIFMIIYYDCIQFKYPDLLIMYCIDFKSNMYLKIIENKKYLISLWINNFKLL